LKSLSWIRFSVDAGSPRTYHDIHCTGSAEFRKVIDNIKYTVDFKKKHKLKKLNKNFFIYLLIAILLVAVGVLGYLYYKEIGCLSGTCAITSKPLNSTLYGGLMGGLLFNLFVTSPKKN
jgi:hypothetical protein